MTGVGLILHWSFFYEMAEKTFKERAARVDNTSIEDLLMEKICIVRRRIQSPAPAGQPSLYDRNAKATGAEFLGLPLCQPDGNGKQHASPFRTAVRDDDHVIRIQLTPEQCKVVRSSGCADEFIGRILGNINLDLESYEDGQIVFNIHLKQIRRTDMLDSKRVCQMLQVSRSFLARLVRTETLKSYKLGRLRRFLLEDILEYLSQVEVKVGLGKGRQRSAEVLMERHLGKEPVMS